MDKFDEIWKNRFNESDVPIDSDWISPDDMVWDGIDDHLKKDSKRKGWLWFWWGAGVSILILGGLAFAFKGEKKGKATPISDKQKEQTTEVIIKKDVDVFSNSITTIENDDSKKEELPLSENPLFTKKINQKPEAFSQSKFTASFPNQSISIFKRPIIETTSQNPIFEIFPSRKNFPMSTDEISTASESSTRQEVSEFSKLLSLKAFLLTDLKQKLVPGEVNPMIQPIKKADKFHVSFNAGAVYWQHRISDEYTSDLSPFEFDYSDNFGWQTSVTGGLSIGNYFEVNTGVRLEKIQVSSGHNSDLNYDPTAETNSRQANDYSLSLATPYGLSPADFVLNRTADVGNGNVALKVDFHSSHNITNIQVPANIRFYPFGKNRRLTAFAETGASFNFLTKVTNEIERIETHHDAIQFTDNGQAFTDPEITKEFYDLHIGGGLVYRFSNQFKINFSYDYSRGLNPVFEQQNYKTVIDRQHISLGMTKTF